MTNLRIWLDDQRPMPTDYTHHVHNIWELLELLESTSNFEIELMSFDYYLGDATANGLDIMKLLADKVRETKDKRWWPKQIKSQTINKDARFEMVRFYRAFDEVELPTIK